MNLANLDFYRENEEDFSEILYDFRKKSYEESEDYFFFSRNGDTFVVVVSFVYEVIPGKYSSACQSPDEYYDSRDLIGWAVRTVRELGDYTIWTHEEFLETLDERGKMCFNSELKKFIDLHS